MRNL
ncbi:formate dehydrogenase formation protein, partial [Escherichia coli EC4448]|jgi:chromosome segregation ATPase